MSTAWDGTEAEFWRAVQAHVDGTFTEGDAAVLSEVLSLAVEKHTTQKPKHPTDRT